MSGVQPFFSSIKWIVNINIECLL